MDSNILFQKEKKKKITNYKNIEELVVSRKTKYIIIQNLPQLRNIIYSKYIYSINIDSCPNITKIPYLFNVKEIILNNQNSITMIPREYKNQLIYLKINNCRWLNSISEKNSINSWFRVQDTKFTNLVKNIKLKKNKYQFLQYYDKIFYNQIDINILNIIVDFLI